MNPLSFLLRLSGVGRLATGLVALGLFSAAADAQSVSRFAQTVNVVNGWNYETEAQGAPAGFDCNSNPESYAVQPGVQFSTAWLTASAFPSFNIPAGHNITNVQARILLRFDINKSGQIDVDARVAGAWNVVSNNFNVPAQGTGNCAYQQWTVQPPAGGWTLADVQNLGLRVRRTTNTTNSGNFRVKAFELVVSYQTPPPVVYCTSSTTTSGCTPTMGWSGVPSASASSGFTINCTNVEGQRGGLMFYGVSGRSSALWFPGSTSTMCVKSPVQRLSLLNSGGTAGACNGAMSEDWLAWLSTFPSALGEPFAAGQVVNAQCWFRDPPAPGTTNLSNGLEFTLQL
jgi:hypothetical protein